MMYTRVSIEAHRHSATLYVAGLLGDMAAERAEEIVASLMLGVRMLRVDLRAVDLIDPTSFVRVARALNQWRDVRRGRVSIEFPDRRRAEATRERAYLQLVGQPTNGMAVSTAIS